MVHLRVGHWYTGGAVVAAALLTAGCQSAPGPAAPSAVPTAGPVTRLVDRQVDAPTAFSSASGNVGCLPDARMARCDISERNWAPPLRPADCELAYGQGVTLRVGRPAEFVCAGDTALGPEATLDPGHTITAGGLRCESAGSAIACRELETGHGFSLSPDAYHLF
jgi:hypothetical protein